MKNLIAMMNAMKVYKTNELVEDAANVQEKLGKDINALGYRKMLQQIHTKHFRTINCQ